MDWGSKVTYLASTTFKERTIPFGMKDADRQQHLCVLGRVGSGRAKLLARMALQDIERGVGMVVLDASGNLGPLIMERLNAEQLERLIYLDASDGEYPFSWKSVDDFRATEKGKILFKDTLPSMYGVQKNALTDFVAEYILEVPTLTTLDLFTLLTDERDRAAAFPAESDGAKRISALMEEFSVTVKTVTEGGRFLAKDTMVRNLLGQDETKFTLQSLPNGAIAIVDLSRIRIFPTRIGPLIRLFIDATRAQVTDVAPIAVYLHDCLHYLTEADTERIFTDHTVSIALSDTVYRETDMPQREKALQKCGSIITFQPHQADAPLIERLFYPYVSSEELLRLETGEACVALSIDAQRSKPFFATALELPERTHTSLQDILITARQKYTTTRAKAEQQFKKDTTDVDTRKGPPGQFSDAFKNIFAKRNATKEVADGRAATPASTADGVQTPPASKSTTEAPAPTVASISTEVEEEVLRQILYVGPLPA